MSKINYKTLSIPTVVNFAELVVQVEGEVQEFEASDNGRAEEQMVSNMQADALLLSILLKLTDKQKIILLYQVLREAGYNLNHEDCAKTLSMTREWYMSLLKEVKKKSAKIIQAGVY